MAKNLSLSYCKVVEVIAETTAPLSPMEELLAKIPSQRAEPKVASCLKMQIPNARTFENLDKKPQVAALSFTIHVSKENKFFKIQCCSLNQTSF